MSRMPLAFVLVVAACSSTVPTAQPVDDLATAPDLALPDLATPDLATPDLATPDLATPDLATTDLATPDLATPDLALPDLALPDLALPDLAMPDLTPTCTDGVKNGAETDVDCGGTCGGCGAGKACGGVADCATGLACVGGVCGACTDSAQCQAGWACAVGLGACTDPASGCADGTREGFTDQGKWPTLAGCAATWQKLAPCPPAEPGTADGKYGCSACAAGWHVCATPPGDVTGCPYEGPSGANYAEVTSRATYADCKAQPGWFAGGAVFATSGHPCGVSSNGQNHFGCGTDTGGNGGATGTDCTGYLVLANVNCNNSSSGSAACLAVPQDMCTTNADAGNAPHWHGVLCCKN